MNGPVIDHRAYAEAFAEFERSLNGAAQHPFHAVRKKALARFLETGFPTTRDEEWRFTNVGPIAQRAFKPASGRPSADVTLADVERFTFAAAHRLVFVNGVYAPHLSDIGSLPRGVVVDSLSAQLALQGGAASAALATVADHSAHAFAALNTAFAVDGAFLSVPEGVVLEEPVSIVYLALNADGLLIAPRNLVLAGPRSRMTIVETYVGSGTEVYLTAAVTEMIVAEGAVVEHDKLQVEGEKAFHVSAIHVRQEAETNYVSNSIALGGSLVRNDIASRLGGERSECTLNGLSIANGSQLIDNHTVIDHAVPNCASHEVYKAILTGSSRGVFNGKIFVRKDAQKTDAKQTNKTLLLSDEATIDTKPQLEIFADDVKCTHGATVGQLDEQQVFYLRSRGIAEPAARDILTFAFAQDVVSRVHDEALKGRLEDLVHDKLGQGRIPG